MPMMYQTINPTRRACLWNIEAVMKAAAMASRRPGSCPAGPVDSPEKPTFLGPDPGFSLNHRGLDLVQRAITQSLLPHRALIDHRECGIPPKGQFLDRFAERVESLDPTDEIAGSLVHLVASVALAVRGQGVELRMAEPHHPIGVASPETGLVFRIPSDQLRANGGEPLVGRAGLVGPAWPAAQCGRHQNHRP